MLAIKESVTDMSPYVRKTAANAIPKLFSLDPEQKEQLEEVIEKLLKDQTTVSSTIVISLGESVCDCHLPSNFFLSPFLPPPVLPSPSPSSLPPSLTARSRQCGDGV